MRMRRKKHLDERLDALSDYLIVPEKDIVNVKEAIKDKKYLDFNAIFNNDNRVELEIGCGKGRFITEKAKANPNVNYIAVELLENIIVMACELAKMNNLKNVKFINSGAEYLPRYVKEKSISNIYLNFSPPFPKDGYESRRLTSERYVPYYKEYLTRGGKIYQKTDDLGFFKYSFSKFVEHGFLVEDVTEKLLSGEIDNVQTEYELKFKEKGISPYALIAEKI